MEGMGGGHWHGDFGAWHGRTQLVAPKGPQGYQTGGAQSATSVGLSQALLDGHFRWGSAGLGFVELGKLFMKVPHCGIRRLFGHLAALRCTLQMEGAIILRAHRKCP
jgi:hypothetical protein